MKKHHFEITINGNKIGESSNKNILDLSSNKEVALCIGQVQSGKTNKVFELIKDAIEKYEYNNVIIFSGTTKILCKQMNGRIDDQLDEFLKNKDLRLITTNTNFKYNPDHKYVFSLLKDHSWFETFYKNIENIDFSNKKFLIIDDECDYASINTSREEVSSKTFKFITKIFEKLNYVKLLMITATPFANILSNKLGIIQPTRIFSFPTNIDYTGLDYFFEHGNIYEILDSNIENDESIELAFQSWLIQTAQLLLEKGKNKKSQLLINICSGNDEQENLSLKIKNLIYKYDSNSNWETILKNKITEIDLDKNPRYKEIILHIFKNIDMEKNVIMLNQKSMYKDVNDEQFEIIIGGNYLSRGNTFENIIVQLFLNSPNTDISIDTLLQRCRWFGYRKETIKFMKIFLRKDSLDALKAARKYNDLIKYSGEYDYCKLKNKLEEYDKETFNASGTSNNKRR